MRTIHISFGRSTASILMMKIIFTFLIQDGIEFLNLLLMANTSGQLEVKARDRENF